MATNNKHLLGNWSSDINNYLSYLEFEFSSTPGVFLFPFFLECT